MSGCPFGVRLADFVAATFIGVIPATFTFAFVGAGLDSAIAVQETAYNACMATGRGDCRLDFDLKTALTQVQLNIPVMDGKLMLGTWQGVYLFEHRARPSTREIVLHLVGE